VFKVVVSRTTSQVVVSESDDQPAVVIAYAMSVHAMMTGDDILNVQILDVEGQEYVPSMTYSNIRTLRAPVPPDAIRLLRSEYHQMLEQAQTTAV